MEEITSVGTAAPVVKVISVGSKSQTDVANGTIKSENGRLSSSPKKNLSKDSEVGHLSHQNSRYFKIFYGMSSDTAMKKHSGGVADYRSSEGKTVKVPYRGPISATLNDICGGVRSTCTYVGAKELKELSKRTTFVRVTQQLNPVFSEALGVDTKTPKGVGVDADGNGTKRQRTG